MIDSYLLELPLFRTYFHGSKGIRTIEGLLQYLLIGRSGISDPWFLFPDCLGLMKLRNLLNLEEQLHVQQHYCQTLNICGIKFSRVNGNDILGYFNFYDHDIPWLLMVKKIDINL